MTIFITLSLILMALLIPHHQATIGSVIRDSQGTPILATSRKIGYFDVPTIKAIALRQCLQQAINQRFHQIQDE